MSRGGWAVVTLSDKQLYDPNISGYTILYEALNLVIQSRKPWPIGQYQFSQPPDFSDWFVQCAGWDLIDGKCVVKVMIRIRFEPDDEQLGIAYVRLAKLIFDELSSSDFDVNSKRIGEWFEDHHGYSYQDQVELLGFFIEDEPGFGTRPDLWKKPQALYLDVRRIDFDASRGRDYQLDEWKMIETYDEWSSTQIQDLDFSRYQGRLMSQAANSEIVSHLDHLTYVWEDEQVFQPDWKV